MVAQPGTYQASANAGELAPRLHGRTDVKQYYSAAALMLNLEPVPQGGFGTSARTKAHGFARHAMTPIAPTLVAAPAGPHGPGAVIAEWSFTAAAVAAVDVDSFVGSVASPTGLQVEVLSDGTWHPMGPPFDIATSPRTRRAGFAPGSAPLATGLRLRQVGAAAPTVTYFSIALYAETASPTPTRLRPFTFSRDQAYIAAFTPGHVDFWRGGVFVGCAAAPVGTAAQLAEFDAVQRLDTMVLAHEEIPTWRLFRDGANHEWQSAAQAFTNPAEADLGGSYAKTEAVFTVYVKWTATGSPIGAVVVLTCEGVNTEGVTIADAGGGVPNIEKLGADLVAALEALGPVGPGLSYEAGLFDRSASVTIGFNGAENIGHPFTLTGLVVNSGDTSLTVVEVQRGRTAAEPLASGARGYPRCAAFYQDRLVLGGYPARPNGVLFSVTGDYFNQNIELEQADGAILVGLDTDGAETVNRIVKARYLVFFTSEGEYFIADRTISRTQPPNVVECSRNGAKRGVPIVESEGALLYVDRTGSLVYAASYSDISQAYDSEPISLLASHIVAGIVDAALQKATDESDANRYWLVRADGSMTCGVMIRNQDVTAFVRWQTDGRVQAVAVDGANRPFVVVRRTVAGVARDVFEELVPGTLLDAAVPGTVAGATVTGLDLHEGAEVWADADGFLAGPFTVAGGALTLPFPASAVTVGRWTPPRFQSLPLLRQVAERTVAQRPVRVHTVRLHVLETTSLAIGANGQAPEAVPLTRAGAAADTPIAPYSGPLELTGLVGWTETGTVEVTQRAPGRLAVRDLVYEAKG